MIEQRAPAVATAYLACAVAYIYAIANPGLGEGSDATGVVFLVVGIVLHLATGWLGRRPWLVLLPVAAALLSVPAGYPESEFSEPLPIWFGFTVFIAPIGCLLILAGVLGGRLRERRDRRA